MKYPAWAPQSLAQHHQKLVDGPKDGPNVLPASREEAEILGRLLTRIEMKTAWKTIYETPIRSDLPRILEAEDNANALWWGGFREGLQYFQRAPKRTVAENKRTLERLAKISRRLAAELRKDPVASRLTEFLIQNHVGKNRNKLCAKSYREPVPWNEADYPAMAIWRDYDHASDVLRRGLIYEIGDDEEAEFLFKKKDGTFWSCLPEIERFAYWTTELGELNLIILLRALSIELNSIASRRHTIEISQPGRKDAGRLPFMLRWMSNHMHSRYGKPLDETVGIIVSVALDLPEILTREAVRAYLKQAPRKNRPK